MSQRASRRRRGSQCTKQEIAKATLPQPPKRDFKGLGTEVRHGRSPSACAWMCHHHSSQVGGDPCRSERFKCSQRSCRKKKKCRTSQHFSTTKFAPFSEGKKQTSSPPPKKTLYTVHCYSHGGHDAVHEDATNGSLCHRRKRRRSTKKRRGHLKSSKSSGNGPCCHPLMG